MAGMGLDHKIIWHQLNCSDLDAAAEFYSELFGWTTRPEERDTYTHFYLGKETVAGAMAMHGPEDPAQWTMHFGSDHIEGLAGRVEQAGGTLLTPIMEIEHTGKLCSVGDPTGGTWMAFEPSNPERTSWGNRRRVGYFAWSELLTSDLGASREFYGTGLGFGVQDKSMGTSPYSLLTNPDRPDERIAGLMPFPQDSSHWHSYVMVKGVDASLELACTLGAQCVAGPDELPDGARFAVITDPQGAVLGLLQG